MRQAAIYYRDTEAGRLTETDEGIYVFQYLDSYVKAYPTQFIAFTMPVTDKPYTDKDFS